MRGANIQYVALGSLLREGRERQGMNLKEAALIIGLTNFAYLWRCESGRSNFPVGKLKRACDLYKIPVATAIEKATEDYKKCMLEALK